MDNTLQKLREKSMRLPQTPGVYLMKNAKGEIIYVGKAKDV
jgi:excinuclease ABC subunit C